MAPGTLSVQRVVATCRERATEFRKTAKQYTHSRNRDLELEYLGMALAADRLADEFEQLLSPAMEVSPEQIDERAKEIRPEPFEKFSAMVARLQQQGIEANEAHRSAQLTYGQDMEDARREARKALESERAEDGDESAYGRGFGDAIDWHEERAREADHLEAQEQNADRKAKLKLRADRHRLYACKLRGHLSDRQAALQAQLSAQRQLEGRQQALPLGGIPIAVQAAFLKRTDNVAGETFD